jgi:hypothetical protein
MFVEFPLLLPDLYCNRRKQQKTETPFPVQVTPRPNVFLNSVAAGGGGGTAAPAAVRTGGVSATILRVATQAGLLLLLRLPVVIAAASCILPATVSWSPKPSSSDIVSRLGGPEQSSLRGIEHPDQGWGHAWYYATLGSGISLLTCAGLFGWALARFQKLLVRHRDIRAYPPYYEYTPKGAGSEW